MFEYTLVFLLVVCSQERRVEGSAGLRFSGNDSSYAEYEPWSWFPNATLQFFFQTSSRKKALLFYQDDGGLINFMSLFLTRSGFAKFRARLGLEWAVKEREIKRNFADSRWHKVRIKIDGTKLYFTIEDENGLVHTAEPPVEMRESAPTRTSVLFVAGIPLSLRPSDFSDTKLFLQVLSNGTLAMFEGCIGDIRVYRPSTGQLDKVKLRKSANAEDTCLGACNKVRSYNGGRCIDRIWYSECDCSATGFKGDRCQTRSHTAFLNTPDERGGYIYQSLNDDSPLMNTERNTVSFMFLTEKKNGVFFYMGRDEDHLVVELVNGGLRVEADVGGGVFANESNLADSCWHHVEVRRKKARLTVIIDKEKYRKIRQESSPTHVKLNLNNKTSNVIYYGGGPSEKLWFAQAKPLYFMGFLKQFYFEEINVIKNALISQSKGFKISDPLGVGIVEKNNSLLQSVEYNCRPELVGLGCFSDDDTDLSCIPSTTTPTIGSREITATMSENTTLATAGPLYTVPFKSEPSNNNNNNHNNKCGKSYGNNVSPVAKRKEDSHGSSCPVSFSGWCLLFSVTTVFLYMV